MRFPILAALVLMAGAAQAQAPLTGTTSQPGSPAAPMPAASAPPAATQSATTPPAAAAPARRRRTMQERFDAANVTHDGHLTQEQARAHMPAVARDFAQIDTDHKGYVTMDDIRAHNRAVRAAHRAARKAAAPQQ